MRVNVGLAQIYPKIGDVKTNLQKHLDYINQAVEKGVDLLVFPELSLTGYQVQDLVPEVAIKARADDPTFAVLLEKSKQLDLVFGFVHEDERQRFYIASAYLSGGEVVHIHHKLYLPTYNMFDEGRYFDQGEHVRAFDTRFGRIGMLICEDFWHMSPAYLLWLDGADMLVFISSSPSRGLDSGDRLSGTRWVELVNQAYGSMFTDYVIYCNRVGYEDGKNFWGGSSIVDPDGEFVVHGTYFDEALITQSIDLNQLHRTRSRLPLLRDERPTLVQRELARILMEYPRERSSERLKINTDIARRMLTGFIGDEIAKTGLSRAVLGLSGGIDSAISSYLSAEVLGAKNVLAVRMPYRTSSADSLADADEVIKVLGIQSLTVPITDMADPLINQFPDMSNTRKGNIMARLRMTVLYDQSVAFGGLVMGTSNKTEILLGYSTIYGDSGVALQPIADLFKTQVRQLAAAIGLPESVRKKAPSADLWEGQTDEGELGYTYDEVDKVLFLLVDERYTVEEVIDEGFDRAFVEKVWRRVKINHYKRTMPNIAKVSRRTVGHDFLYLRDYT